MRPWPTVSRIPRAPHWHPKHMGDVATIDGKEWHACLLHPVTAYCGACKETNGWR